MSIPLWAGVDLGGTGTRMVLADGTGESIAGRTVPTESLAASGTDGLADLIGSLVPEQGTLMGVGVGASGPVDLRTGLIHNADTLPAFSGLDVAGDLQRRLSVPTWIDNDAVAAGLAEAAFGAATGTSSVLCVTLGTGVGAAVIQHGTPVRSADGQHPEGGHLPVPGSGHPCYCGLAQCWEQVASRRALDRLQSVADPRSVWSYYAEDVAWGLIALITLYRPECVVVGGSVAQHWEFLEHPLRRALMQSRECSPALRVLPSSLGERGGALGASLLPQHEIGWHR